MRRKRERILSFAGRLRESFPRKINVGLNLANSMRFRERHHVYCCEDQFRQADLDEGLTSPTLSELRDPQ